MKKLYITILLSLAVFTPKFLQTEYTLTTEVIFVGKPEIAAPEGYVVCKSDNNKYYTFKGSEDWMQGDIVELTFTDNGTAYRTDDDKIIKTIYKE